MDLQKAKEKAEKVSKKIKSLKSEREISKSKEILIEYLNQHPDSRTEILIELTVTDGGFGNVLPDKNVNQAIEILQYHFSQMSHSEKEDYLKFFEDSYEPEKNVTNDIFNMALNHVKISSHAPTIHGYLPSYLITFTKVTLSDMMITPDCEYTQKHLFKKVFSDDITNRGFLATEFYGKEEKVFLQIADVRFDVSRDVAEELSTIVDEYYSWYTSLLIEVERQRGTLNAQLFCEESYVIAEMPKELWYLIADYIDENSNRDWTGFEKGHGRFIKLFQGIGLLNVYLRHEVVDGKVYVLWLDFYKREHMSKYWNFEKSYDWFFDNLLPKFFEWDRNRVNEGRKIGTRIKNQINYVLGRKNTVTSKKGDYGYDLKKHIIGRRDPNLFIDLTQKIESEDYQMIVQRLQYFYDTMGNWKNVYLSDDQVKKFFEAMVIILNKEGIQTHPNYLAGNLSFVTNRFRELKIKDLVFEIEKTIRETQLLNDYGICFAIRNIEVASRDCTSLFSTEEIKEILNRLNPLIEFYNRSNAMEKFSKHLKNKVLD